MLFSKFTNNVIFKRVIKGSLWMLTGSVIPKFFVVLTFILVARIIGQENYGKLSMLRSTITMFGIFAGFGIGLTSSRFIAQNRDTNIKKATEIYRIANFFSTVLGVIILSLVFLFSDRISIYLFDDNTFSFALKIISIALLFIALNEAQNGTLSGLEDFKSIAINTSITTTIQCFTIILFSYYFDILGVVIGLSMGNILLWAFNRRTINKKKIFAKLRLKNIPIESWKLLWTFSLPAALSGFLVFPVIWWAKSFLVLQANFSELAIFDVAEQWSSIVQYLPAIFGRVFFPILSNTFVSNTDKYYQTIKLNLIINLFIGFSFVSVFSIGSNFIMSLYGEGFMDNTPLILALFAVIFSIGASIVGQVIASSGNMWSGFILNFIWASIYVILNLVLVGKLKMGATGLSLSLLLSYFIHFLISSLYVYLFNFRKKKI